MSSQRKKVTAEDVRNALHGPKGPLGPPAHAVLHEVADRTGSRISRFADTVVVSCWPQRGLWFGGVEIKVSRSDWLAELANPAKSAAVQQYCKYWWLAAPPGVVDIGEVPETWGLYTIDGKKAVLSKRAPELEAVPPSLSFVASVLRNAEKSVTQVCKEAVNRAVSENALRHQKEAEAAYETRKAQVRLERELEFAKRERDDLRKFIEEFERGVGEGFQINRYRSSGHDEGQLFRFARSLRSVNYEYIARTLDLVMIELRELQKVTNSSSSTESQSGDGGMPP